MPSQAAHPERPDDLVTRLRAFLAPRDRRPEPYLGVHHQRLDRETSGNVLFTKRPEVRSPSLEALPLHGPLALLFVTCVVSCGGSAPPPAFDTHGTLSSNARFVVVGDVQRTGLPERVPPFLREENDRERAEIFEAIATRQPDLVVMTGDVVFEGTSSAHWSRFDRETALLRERHIPVVTAFGNHEYCPFPYVGNRTWARKDAEANVFRRFPMTRAHWFVVPFGPLRIVILDSNRAAFTDEEWTEQRLWFSKQLDTNDAAADVRGVVVVFHHPPITNSSLYGDGEASRADFRPVFAAHKKTMAILNGHVHSYERFVFDEKTYVVSGGGGGPRIKVQPRRFRDVYPGAGIELRDFHFTTYSLEESGLRAVVEGIAKGSSEFYEMDNFEIRWPEVVAGPIRP